RGRWRGLLLELEERDLLFRLVGALGHRERRPHECADDCGVDEDRHRGRNRTALFLGLAGQEMAEQYPFFGRFLDPWNTPLSDAAEHHAFRPISGPSRGARKHRTPDAGRHAPNAIVTFWVVHSGGMAPAERLLRGWKGTGVGCSDVAPRIPTLPPRARPRRRGARSPSSAHDTPSHGVHGR